MDDIEDEVTFLLRLKPTATPPIKKKFRDDKSRKWDIVIEHHNSDVESMGSHQNSPLAGRRFSYDNHRFTEPDRINSMGNVSPHLILNSADMGYPRDAYNSNISPSMMHRISTPGGTSHSSNYSQEAPPLPPRWQPSAPPQEEDVHLKQGVSEDSSYLQQMSPESISTYSNASYYNFPQLPSHRFWSDGRNGAPTQAPLSPTVLERSFHPTSFMEIQTPQKSPPPTTYSNGDEISVYISRNSTPAETPPPNFGKPPFFPSSQPKTVRPPKPSPRSSVVREIQGVNERNVVMIERTHSLKTIRTNPFFSTQDHTRSLGRKQLKIPDPTISQKNTSTIPSVRDQWTLNTYTDGHGTIFKPMLTRPEPVTSEHTYNLTSQELNSDINIDRCGVDEDDEQASCLLKHNEDSYKRLSGTDSSASESLTSSSSAADSTDCDDDSDTEREYVIVKGLETIAEEERITPSSIRSSRKDLDENESSSTEEPTKGRTLGWCDKDSTAGSTSDLSSSNSLEGRKSLRGSSTRCNSDFQWLAKDVPPLDAQSPKMDEQTATSPTTKPPINRNSVREKVARRDKAPGSLDRRRIHHTQNRQERDQKSRSSHVKSPSKLEDFQPCQNWCCNPVDNFCLENFHRRHERNDPHKYGSSPMLMDQRGSHPDIYGDMNRCRHDMMGCCSYHMVPPPCYFYGERGYRWTPPPYSKPSEQDEKLRKLQFDKDNLQLQVQVLTDQIEAQSYKISDLEKTLQDKKHCLVEAEEKLQREMLSRSSLETQKLELMSIISDLKLQQAAMERENMELRNSHFNNNGDLKKPPLLPRGSPQPHLASTPIQHSSSNQAPNLRISPSPSPITILNSTRRSDSNYTLQDLQPPKTPPANYKRQIDIHYASLPRQQFLTNGGGMSAVDFNANPSANGGKKAVAFGRGFTNLIGVRSKGFSVPNLAQAEKGTEEENNDAAQLQINKNKGIKKIFGKIKRSGSGNLEDLPGLGEFQRGGVRATAAARLGWSEPHLTQKPDKPFGEWDTENICDWLQDLGLDQYIPEAKKWVKNGQQLQECAIAEVEKELNIRNPLHKKKLQLALIDAEENGSSDPFLRKAGVLDTAWVLRWLDDIGLPQYKESFLINRVDGRVLHRLTVDDLGILHVSSLLHVASIKRGIQVLRENDYNAACLKRRSVPDEEDTNPKQVSLWSTHRVMEWLRAVDLSEYAPKLRGAGVHGGLMVYETKFTAELLASLLSISPGKTLLRRHLNTHFKELLSREIIQEKREAESTLGYIPLTPTSKLKITKKSQFSLKRKKSKGEADYGDLVCPLNPEKQSGEMNGSALNSSMGTTRKNLEEEAAYHLVEKGAKSLPASVTNSPVSFRNMKLF